MFIARTVAWIAVLSLTTVYVYAGGGGGLSAGVDDSYTLAIQKKVDKLFDAGDYDRALFIYRNELSPLGDKYAQYMIGFMHAEGLGVEEDAVQATAWYGLAAERGTAEFIAVRDQAMRGLTDEQRRRSDVLLKQLRLEFGDLAILLASVKRDLQELRSRTGSRLGGDSSPVSVISPRTGSLRSGRAYFQRIERRVEERLRLIIEAGGFEGVETDPKRVDLQQLETLVREALE